MRAFLPLSVSLCVFPLLSVTCLVAGVREPAFAAGNAGTADKDTVKLVELFAKTPTADLPPEAIPAYMEIDADTLPDKTISYIDFNGKTVKAKMKVAYGAKKEELLALRRLAEGKRKPPIRRLGLDDPKCGEPPQGTEQMVGMWHFAGFSEADEQDVDWVSAETHCSTCELETEFTLKRMAWTNPPKADKRYPPIRFFFHEKDPIWVLIVAHHTGKNPFGTAFFGVGKPTCH